MKPDWNRRFAAGLLAILLCLCSFSMPAFASGSDPAPEPLPEIIEEEPTTGGMEPEGAPITPKGNATLVDDFYGDKQLITVTTKAGNYFYILIDRANEDKETGLYKMEVSSSTLMVVVVDRTNRLYAYSKQVVDLEGETVTLPVVFRPWRATWIYVEDGWRFVDASRAPETKPQTQSRRR